jgi:hypothetical protein
VVLPVQVAAAQPCATVAEEWLPSALVPRVSAAAMAQAGMAAQTTPTEPQPTEEPRPDE